MSGPIDITNSGHVAPETVRNLYIAGLPEDFSDEELQTIFSSCGEIEAAKCMFERDTGKCKGYGFVLYVSADSAAQATRRFHKSVVRGKQLTVRLSHPTATPRRDGSSGGLPGSQPGSANSMDMTGSSFLSTASLVPSPQQQLMFAPSAPMMMQQGGIIYQAAAPQGGGQIMFVQQPHGGGQTFIQQPGMVGQQPQQQILIAAPQGQFPTYYYAPNGPAAPTYSVVQTNPQGGQIVYQTMPPQAAGPMFQFVSPQ